LNGKKKPTATHIMVVEIINEKSILGMVRLKEY
jgi:hypothetical protein